MTERVLSDRELNRATLARQLLLARVRGPVARAVRRIAGLQAQYSPGPYVNLWSRVEGFRIEQLERALARHTVVKASLLRVTLHLVAAQDYPAFAAAMTPHLANHWRRWHKREDVPGIERIARKAVEYASEPRLAEELRALVSEVAPDEDPKVVLWRVWTHTPFVEVPPSGMWRYFGKAHLVPGEAWVGTKLPPYEAAITRLCESYLAGFGPATRNDLANWCALRIGDVQQGLEALEPRLRRFRDEAGRELIDLKRAPLPGDVPAPPRFLLKFDNALMANVDRSRVLPPEYRDAVVSPKNGDVVPTFLVDGYVAGKWRHEGGRVRLEPFAPLPGRVKQPLEAEARRLASWLGRERRR